jgi:polar amino acid transport system substrate-binding protein
VAFNLQAIELVTWSDQTKSLSGVNSDLADAIARELGVTVDWSLHQGSVPLFDTGRQGQWDIAFAVIEPVQGMAFTNPFLEMDQTYLVPAASPVRRSADADVTGNRIAMFGGSFYERYLTRTLTRASVVRTGSTRLAIDLVLSGDAEIVAASRGELTQLLPRLPGGRILDEPVIKTRWAIVAAAGRQDLLTFLGDWVERAKLSGRVRDAIAQYALVGAAPAQPGP